MGRRTPLYELHRSLGARLIDFGGWDLPLTYGSQLDEHHAVRRAAGLFDVSHMGILDVSGRGARALLERVIANDVGKLLRPGKALYGCMLNESGGVLDDLIVYYLGAQHAGQRGAREDAQEGAREDAQEGAREGAQESERFRIVVNGATRAADLAWIRSQASPFAAEILERVDLALVAVQGPEAREQVARLLAPAEAASALALGRFDAAQFGELYLARTGYTGEDGFEVMLHAAQAEDLWRRLTAQGVVPCGLGARDTLRLEAGLNLYGHDMDASTHPFESRLGWTVALAPRERRFIGRVALEAVLARGCDRKLVGLELEGRGVLRAGQRVLVAGTGEGRVTSGTFSPTLQRSIALARVPAATAEAVQVDIRGKLLDARVVEPPFVRRGAARASHLQTKGSP